MTGLLLNGCFKQLDKLLEFIHIHFVIKRDATLFLYINNDSLKRINVFLIGWFHAENNVTVHLNKATVAVISKAFIAGLTGQTFYNFIIETEIKNGIHHTGHAGTGSRTYTDEQRIIYIAKL